MQPPGLILDLKKQYALPVYYLDNIETISEETIEFQINDQLFFEVLLMEILGKTISYATHIKREETTLERQLIEEIRLFENSVNAITMTRIEKKEKKKKPLSYRQLETEVWKVLRLDPQ